MEPQAAPLTRATRGLGARGVPVCGAQNRVDQGGGLRPRVEGGAEVPGAAQGAAAALGETFGVRDDISGSWHLELFVCFLFFVWFSSCVGGCKQHLSRLSFDLSIYLFIYFPGPLHFL